MRLGRLFALVAISVVLLLLVAATLSTPALAAPFITLSPTSGTVGTSVTIKGENFTSYAGDQVYVYFGVNAIEGGTITIPRDGKFTYTFVVPKGAMPGKILVTIRTEQGIELAQAEFVVPKPDIVLDKGGGVVGTSVAARGGGFGANQKVTFTYIDRAEIVLGEASTSPIGEFEFAFTIPESTGKTHKVIATDSLGNRAEATLVVIPAVSLEPVSGAIGDVVVARGTGFGYKSRFVIDFDKRQVKTDRTDEVGSFEVSFAVPDMPLRAYNVTITDTEGNSVVTTFTINAGEPSFIFPQWGIYALMGLGGLGLFLLGLWLGRKYAYTY